MKDEKTAQESRNACAVRHKFSYSLPFSFCLHPSAIHLPFYSRLLASHNMTRRYVDRQQYGTTPLHRFFNVSSFILFWHTCIRRTCTLISFAPVFLVFSPHFRVSTRSLVFHVRWSVVFCYSSSLYSPLADVPCHRLGRVSCSEAQE